MACRPRVVGQRGFVAVTQPACPVVHSKASLSSLFAVIHPTRWTSPDSVGSGCPRSLGGLDRLRQPFEPGPLAPDECGAGSKWDVQASLGGSGGGCWAFQGGKLGLAAED